MNTEHFWLIMQTLASCMELNKKALTNQKAYKVCLDELTTLFALSLSERIMSCPDIFRCNSKYLFIANKHRKEE